MTSSSLQPNGAITAVALLAAVALVFLPASASAQPAANSALSFDGVEDLVMWPNHPALELTDGTLELWFKPDWAPGSIDYEPTLIANRQGASFTRYSLHVDRNLARVMLANGNSVSAVPYSFARGQWYHLALSESGSTGQVYVNGQFIGATTNGFGTLIGQPLYLGSDGEGQFFRGQIDEVRIWSVARNTTDIRFNLSRALAGTEAGLVAYWRLNDGNGATATDATANRFDGTLSGPVWSSSDVVLVNTVGSFGTALDLTASRNSCVQVASAPGLVLSNRLTFEAWIRLRAAQCGTILSRGDGANLATTDYIFQVGTGNTNGSVMKPSLMVAGEWATAASSLPLNAWVHVAVTYDGTNKQFYINGVLDRVVAGTGSVYQSGLPLFIGRQGSVGSNYFDGSLDEVRVWSTARSAAEIQANLTRSGTPGAPGLVAYWRFNEPAGIQAVDASGAGNHGRLVNRPVRVVSFWAPVLTENVVNPATQECHLAFVDPGAIVTGAPIALAVGYTHSLAVKPDGTVTVWGDQSNVPVHATNIVAIAAGYLHSLALKGDGTVLAWGDGQFGQLIIPPNATNVVAIAAGAYHNLVLKGDGTVLAWGRNEYGESEVPNTATNIGAIAAAGSHNLALRADGTVLAWGRNSFGQVDIPFGATNIINVSAGDTHSLALRANGTVVGWGDNCCGQLNVPPGATNVIGIAAGNAFNVALKANGTVLGWGRSDLGQLNIPASATNVMVIVSGGLDHTLALKADGTVLGWGYDRAGEARIPAGLTRLNLVPTLRGSVNADVPGTYVLNYLATNTAGGVASATRTVVVTDTKPPVLRLIGANPLNLDGGVPFVEAGATATDACEGDLTASIVYTGTVSASVPGLYLLTYTVSDTSGNSAMTNRSVAVRNRPSVAGITAFASGTNATTGLPVLRFLGDVNPNGLASTAYFQYGLSTTYAGRTAPISLEASYNLSTFLGTSEGLMPGATYHYRVAASNSLGVTYGPDQTFTLPAPIPGDLDRDGRVDQRELNAVLSNYWPSSPWLAMTNPTTLGGGLFQFALTNAGGWNFSVLVTTNLNSPFVEWTNLGSAWPVWQFHDSAATGQPQRFYRLRWP